MYDNAPVIKVIESGKEFYATTKSRKPSKESDTKELDENGKPIKKKTVNQFVKDYIADIRKREAKIPEAEVFAGRAPHEYFNNDFRFLIIRTPFYQFTQELAASDGAARVPASSVSFEDYWLDNQVKFFADEFFKYSLLFEHIELAVNRSIGGDRALRIRRGPNKMMNLIHVDVAGLFNPLKLVPNLGNKKLFAKFFGDAPADEITSLDEPFVFRSSIKADTVPIYLTTQSDFLKLIGIDGNISLNASDVYRIIAGICMKTMFPTVTKHHMSQSFTKLPTGVSIYNVMDTSNGASIKAFIGKEKPAYDLALTNENYVVVEISAHAVMAGDLIKNAEKNTFTRADLTAALGGAYFV